MAAITSTRHLGGFIRFPETFVAHLSSLLTCKTGVQGSAGVPPVVPKPSTHAGIRTDDLQVSGPLREQR